ncbi:MAG TPA: hypothetical protein PKD34_02495 [Candidatus Doudnabacteria bacterium]|nr:hypothetical protein [Candidatus Doudnabacteria bacterium]
MSLKDNLQVEAQSVSVGAQEGVWKIKTWFWGLLRWQRISLIVLIVLMIPGYFAVRYGLELILIRQYARQALVAHSAFTDPSPLVVSRVNIIRNSNDTVSGYLTVRNPNLDLGLDNDRYTINFLDNANQIVYTSTGSLYLLPDQQRWIVVPRVESSSQIASAEIEFGELNWQKRLEVPEVELRMNEPFTYQQESPLATVTEGAVVNNSPYSLRQVSLVVVLYGANNQVLAVTSREEYSLEPFERRAYIIQWPNVNRSAVTRIGLEAYTNTLDATNFTVVNNP